MQKMFFSEILCGHLSGILHNPETMIFPLIPPNSTRFTGFSKRWYELLHNTEVSKAVYAQDHLAILAIRTYSAGNHHCNWLLSP